jgi:hypothetical protein
MEAKTIDLSLQKEEQTRNASWSMTWPYFSALYLEMHIISKCKASRLIEWEKKKLTQKYKKYKAISLKLMIVILLYCYHFYLTLRAFINKRGLSKMPRDLFKSHIRIHCIRD